MVTGHLTIITTFRVVCATLSGIMLWVYRIITTVLAPLAQWRLLRMANSVSPLAAKHHAARMGQLKSLSQPPKLWFHAASVGEVNMLIPLIRAHQEHSPILLTTFTPTGLIQAQEQLSDCVDLTYAPLDQYHWVRRWLDRIQPQILILAETELWPELCVQCQQRNIPILVVNARLSNKRFHRYQRLRALYRYALDSLSLVACQSADDAKRWIELGVPKDKVMVTGNLKGAMSEQHPTYDRVTPPLTWVAGSVHPPEFAAIIDAHRQLLNHDPKAKLIIAPRHLRNLEILHRQLDEAQLSWRGLKPASPPAIDDSETVVWVLETMGWLPWAYQQANWAFVGGSLTDIGGHNLYEPAQLGLAIVVGPHVHQQQAAVERLLAVGGLIQVQDTTTLSQAVIDLAHNQDKRKRLGQEAKRELSMDSQSLHMTKSALAPWLKAL